MDCFGDGIALRIEIEEAHRKRVAAESVADLTGKNKEELLGLIQQLQHQNRELTHSLDDVQRSADSQEKGLVLQLNGSTTVSPRNGGNELVVTPDRKQRELTDDILGALTYPSQYLQSQLS